MDAGLAAQWKTVSRLLDEALDLDPSARAAWLANLGPEHAQAKPHVERLLRHHESQGDVSLGDALPSYSEAEISGEHLAGTVIGNYRLERLLGRGGMGAVWLAHSIDGAKLPVALKLLHASAANALAERFRRERDFLTALNHPNIARLIDAGMGADGQPWLALEFIDGGTIPDYCNAKALDIAARLALFVQALRAVQYAHANLVIHRDLKPGNMLVTPTGEVKLLDFGIAKLMDRDASHAAETELTRMAGRVMTPHYASPEQIAGQPLTTASDIYSLGVVLFELLTGSRPYKLKRGSAAELEEAILNADATRPSTSVTDTFAKTLATTPSRWRRLLRGDLDTIVLKAFARAPGDRYASADAFAQDIERYLAGRPVLARRESLAYRATRFVQRNRLAVGAAAAIVVALVVGLVAALWQAGVAREQARLAKDEATKARTIQEFLVSIFEKNSRNQAGAGRARNQTAREVLIEAAERVPTAFADAPAMKVELLATMGRLLLDVEESERAAKLLAEADALAVASGLGQSDLRVEALLDAAAANRLLGRGPEGLKARDDALAILDARGDRQSLLRARAAASPIAALSRERDKATRIVKEGADLFAQFYPTHPQRFLAVATLAQLHRTSGDLEGARVRFREAIDLFDKVGSKDFENLAAAHAWTGFCAFRVGRMSEALAESEVGVRMLGEQVGEQALSTRFHRGLRAEILHRNGQREASFRLFDELRRTAVPGKPTANEFNNAIYEADAHLREGRPARTIALLEPFSATLEEFGKRYYPNGVHWATLLAHAHAVRGDISKAEAALKRTDDVPRNFWSPANTMVQYALDVSWIRLAQGQPDEAWSTVTIDGEMDTAPPDFSIYFVQGRVRMSEIERERRNAPAAVRMARDALAHLQEKSDPASLPDLRAESLRVLGEAHLLAGDPNAALQSLEPAVVAMRGLHDAASPWLADALVSLADARSLAADRARARAHLAEARTIFARQDTLHPRFAAHLRDVARRVD